MSRPALTPEQSREALSLARGTLVEALGGPRCEVPSGGWLDEPGACFVTLTRHGRLRGCIGSVVAHRPLRDDLRENALAAAFHDPRFLPLESSEFDGLRIAITVLTPLEPLPVDDEQDAIRKLRPGVDGLVLRLGGRGATFIPAMWDKVPDARVFLSLLKQKAGLPQDFWSPSITLQRFTGVECEEGEGHQA